MSGFKLLLQSLAGGLIVSCQAPDGDPFRDAPSMARFAQAAERGGAVGIRANSAEDVREIARSTRLPIIGIQKRAQADGKILITPSFDDARALVEAGAQIVAVECTARAQRFGALDLVRTIQKELGVAVMADIATLEEAVAAEEAGVSLVANTMRGYTEETEEIRIFQPEFIAALAAQLSIPVLAEGRVDTPQQAVEALRAGAHAVIVGTAITRPEAITARYVAALRDERGSREAVLGAVIGVDVGGTNTKAAILTTEGILQAKSIAPTPAIGRDVLLRHIRDVVSAKIEEARAVGHAVSAVGIATAGWVDLARGQVVYATENLPGWTGTRLVEELEEALRLPLAIENDVNALAIGERHFGAGRGVDNFVCLTLGTGVGGACYSGGQLLRGAHGLANAIGHIAIDRAGEQCTCGLRGCLESYASAAALVRYAKGEYSTAEEVIRAARAGVDTARRALRQYADYLAIGIASIVHLLDPELVILAGGIAQENDLLLRDLNELLPQLVMAAKIRRLRVSIAELGYYGAVYGAGVAARRKSFPRSDELRIGR